MTDPNLPVAQLELSTLSGAVCKRLKLETVRDLTRVHELEFLEAAYAVARDDQQVAPALGEVKAILAEMGFGLAPTPEVPADVASLPQNGPLLDGHSYLGSFSCSGELVFGEVRFLGGAVNAAAQAAGTIDLEATPRREQLSAISLASVRVEPGVWDAYAFKAPRIWAPVKVTLRRRGSDPKLLRFIGELRMPDPILAIADAGRAGDAAARIKRARDARVGDWGVLQFVAHAMDEQRKPVEGDLGYGWDGFAEAPGAPLSQLVVKSWVGESPF